MASSFEKIYPANKYLLHLSEKKLDYFSSLKVNFYVPYSS